MRLTIVFLLLAHPLLAQLNFNQAFQNCPFQGSVTIYDYSNQRWLFSDSTDALRSTQPASTFKIINLLIALETKTIKDENSIIKWVGSTDTTLYGCVAWVKVRI